MSKFNFGELLKEEGWEIVHDSKTELYGYKVQREGRVFIDRFGPRKNNVFAIWMAGGFSDPRNMSIDLFKGYIRTKEEWDFLKELIQI